MHWANIVRGICKALISVSHDSNGQCVGAMASLVEVFFTYSGSGHCSPLTMDSTTGIVVSFQRRGYQIVGQPRYAPTKLHYFHLHFQVTKLCGRRSTGFGAYQN